MSIQRLSSFGSGWDPIRPETIEANIFKWYVDTCFNLEMEGRLEDFQALKDEFVIDPPVTE